MTLESPRVHIAKASNKIYTRLLDLNNFKQLMPENTEKFKAEEDSFLFALPNMPEIRMVIKDKVPNQKIIFGAASSKLNFTLTVNLEAKEENITEGQLIFNGELNPMMAVMIKKPLTNFINTLSSNLTKI